MEIINFCLPFFILLALWLMYRDNFFSVIPIVFPILILVWSGLSIAYLETGVYSSEINLLTKETGGTFRFVVSTCLFLLGYWVIFRALVSKQWLLRHSSEVSRRLIPEGWLLFLVFFGIAWVIALFLHRPIGSDLSRSAYLHVVTSPLRDFILKYTPFVLLSLGIAAGVTENSRTRLAGYSAIVMFFITFHLYGHKFSGIIALISIIAIPVLTFVKLIPRARPVLGIHMRTQAIIGVFFIMILVAGGIYKYVESSRWNTQEYLKERILILQGEMWWFTDFETFFKLDADEPEDFVSFLEYVNYYGNSSIMFLMSKAVGYDRTHHIIFENRSLYTGAFPAILYKIGGPMGPFSITLIVGAIHGLAAGYVVRKLIMQQVLMVLIGFSIYLPISMVMESGEFMQLFSVNLVIKLFVTLLAESVLFYRRISNPVCDTSRSGGACTTEGNSFG